VTSCSAARAASPTTGGRALNSRFDVSYNVLRSPARDDHE
jgi:hypothetical protein